MNIQKRIGIINDISCVGRCSVTAALPIYAAAGIHGNMIPTALLSTQTGGYDDYTYLDLSAEMLEIAAHFKRLKLDFDVLYTGYLAGERQIELVMETADMLKAKTLIVDPVMGDGGQLYDGFTKKYCAHMKKLCAKADVIVPNMTEACFLTDREYRPLDYENIEGIACDLQSFGPKSIVITGLRKKGEENKIGIATICGQDISLELLDEIEGVYHGAGDVFGAVLACGIAQGNSLEKAASFAHKFTYRAIEITALDKTDTRQGLNFEKCLGSVFEKYNK